MFKKLKDKLAEEVKSSPQRIQQFAQAAQAAVTSASSSISDITNNDLFSIGDNEGQPNRLKLVTSSPNSTFHDASPGPSESMKNSMDSMDFISSQDTMENQRQRRLSNSSIASDVSFRFPSYETPPMYHLQSDMEISASEAEERGFASGSLSLDRVTKEQIYAAYRRTQDRYKKYRTQYADLARHYKLLERENAKAKSVLVETQDKALRRISELREQCTLEQSAKAHLEKVMRDEIDEKNMKIGTLDTKIKLLQNNENTGHDQSDQPSSDAPLIHLATDNENNKEVPPVPAQSATEIQTLHTKVEKMEQLLNKYKDSLKTAKEKNSQLSSELQILSTELETKSKENDELNAAFKKLEEDTQQIQQLSESNEELQNKLNAIDFNKTKEMSCLQEDYQNSQQELEKLRNQIVVFVQREEENAISLAENKLRIHKELESKETEIKALKENLEESAKEIESLNIVINNYKQSVSILENEKSKYNNKLNELKIVTEKVSELQSEIKELKLNCRRLEDYKTKAIEEYNCLQLQTKQETAEKLAMIDRNAYLENRNVQLQEEISKKSKQIASLESLNHSAQSEQTETLINELNSWKSKYCRLESEIQEEREELVKLQSEIEKLLTNHEHLQVQNTELINSVAELNYKNTELLKLIKEKDHKTVTMCKHFADSTKYIKKMLSDTSKEVLMLKSNNNLPLIIEQVGQIITLHKQEIETSDKKNESSDKINKITMEHSKLTNKVKLIKEENERLKNEVQAKKSKISQVEEECLTLSKEYENALNELTTLQNEKQHVSEQAERLQSRLESLQESLEHESDRCLFLEQENEKNMMHLESIQGENELLTKKFETMLNESSNSILEKERINTENEALIQRLQNEIITLEQEKNTSNEKSDRLTAENDLLTKEIESLKAIHKGDLISQNVDKNNMKELKDKIAYLEKVNKELDEMINLAHNEYKSQIKELLRMKDDSSMEILAINKKNQELLSTLEDKCVIMKKIEDNLHLLTRENNSFRMESEKITNSVKDLETELDEVRKSHSDIESEKERLSSIIDKLEAKPESKDNNSQTENSDSTEQNKINEENIKLQEENKRLQSDITSLQAYLAKISKENSALNDQLRELIASSEKCFDKNNLHELNQAEAVNETGVSKEKLDELVRENNLLMEENLELKDQLTSQNRGNTCDNTTKNSEHDMEFKILTEKYNSTSESCKKLEYRLSELEQMNKSMNGNMQNVQERNDKLRLTNEKLERRLDEALVSLRHLHSLQENTELEYLRNILYEYLTGSGTHSLTLAKVLSAVVKFDDSQTQQVLVKEKERQGFLKQLGII